MNETAEWDRWLAEADSVDALASHGWDEDAALERLKALQRRLANALLPTYELRTPSPELFKDSTALTCYYVFASGAGPFAPTRARILLSHFGDLATVRGCHDPELLARVRSLLVSFGLKYIAYDYVAGKTYNGKCKALVGSNWANRYFSLITTFNTEQSRGC